MWGPEIKSEMDLDQSEIKKEPGRVDLENPEANTYDLVKARFEERNFRVAEPFFYGRLLGDDKEFTMLKQEQLKQFYADLSFYSGDGVKKPFIDEWIRDPYKREYERVAVDPTCTKKSVYNLWKGFAAEKLPQLDDDQVDKLVQPIIEHLYSVIVCENQDYLNWLLDYLASIIKRPHMKTGVAVLLCGKQGCGKDILFDFFRNCVLGQHCSFQTADPENDLFNRFSNGYVGNVFIQVDEAKSLHDNIDKLKNFITCNTINYEQKGKDIIVVDNFTNLLFTSNNENALQVPPDDRRFTMLRCSSVRVRDKPYFDSLAHHLKNPAVARAFFQFLLKRSLEKYPYDFQASRPITAFYKEAQQSTIPVLCRFLSAYISTESTPEQIGAADLYRKYEFFKASGNFKIFLTSNSFGREMKKITGASKKKNREGWFYLLDKPAIQQHLQESNEFDPDAIWFD